MCYDAIAPDASAAAAAAAAAPRDIAGAGKKKRVNRSAKLKQCKLDARREQWLSSQVKNKDVKVTGMAVSPTSPLTPPPLSLPRARMGRRDSEMRPRPRPTEEREDLGLNNSSDSESPSHSPTSSCSGRASRKDRPPSCFGSGCSIESSSRTVSDAEFEAEEEATDRGGENGVLDDWEVVADALSVGNDTSNPDSTATDNKVASGSQQDTSARDLTKPEPIHPPPRAWRPDDSSRPRTLPSLSKQRSFTVEMERQCGSIRPLGTLSSHSTCPICCEDLDVTDSRFIPCSCGFHLCLFCHKRILEEDGRCPGCRKQYSYIPGKAVDVGGGGSGASVRLARSYSMFSRA